MIATHFIWPTQVHIYECDSLGHVNNAIYLLYLQETTAQAWGQTVAATWQLRHLAMEYLAPALHGDALEVHAWPQGVDVEGRAVAAYAVRRATDGQTLLRARAAWTWLNRQTGAVLTPGSAWPVATPEPGFTMRPLRLPPTGLNSRRFRWHHRVREYEVGPGGVVPPVHLVRWVEEARMAAIAEVGWPLERLLAADAVAVQVRHDMEILGSLTAADELVIVGCVHELRRVRGTWRHEVYKDDQLIALDYSGGGFLNRAGQPNPAPPDLIRALLEPEPNANPPA